MAYGKNPQNQSASLNRHKPTLIPLQVNFGNRDIPVKWRFAVVDCVVGCFSVFSDVGSLKVPKL